MSYPTRLDLFRAWAKAMEQGATVKTPNYGKAASNSTSGKSRTTARRPRRKRFHRKRKRED